MGNIIPNFFLFAIFFIDIKVLVQHTSLQIEIKFYIWWKPLHFIATNSVIHVLIKADAVNDKQITRPSVINIRNCRWFSLSHFFRYTRIKQFLLYQNVHFLSTSIHSVIECQESNLAKLFSFPVSYEVMIMAHKWKEIFSNDQTINDVKLESFSYLLCL